MTHNSRIVHIELDEGSIKRRSPEVDHERKIAIIDLIDDNNFALVNYPGKYRLTISIRENKLVFDVCDDRKTPIKTIILSLTPFRKIIKDYFVICDSYFEAIKTSSPAQIEAIDMGRRGIHNEGSDLLADRLEDKATMNRTTSRRLFTLVCVLHLR